MLVSKIKPCMSKYK